MARVLRQGSTLVTGCDAHPRFSMTQRGCKVHIDLKYWNMVAKWNWRGVRFRMLMEELGRIIYLDPPNTSAHVRMGKSPISSWVHCHYSTIFHSFWRVAGGSGRARWHRAADDLGLWPGAQGVGLTVLRKSSQHGLLTQMCLVKPSIATWTSILFLLVASSFGTLWTARIFHIEDCCGVESY